MRTTSKILIFDGVRRDRGGKEVCATYNDFLYLEFANYVFVHFREDIDSTMHGIGGFAIEKDTFDRLKMKAGDEITFRLSGRSVFALIRGMRESNELEILKDVQKIRYTFDAEIVSLDIYRPNRLKRPKI